MRQVLFLFGRLKDQDVDWLAAHGTRRVLPPGEVLIAEGQLAQALWIVLDGEVSVSQEAVGGREISRRGVGEVLGELSFVDGAPASATVRAAEACVVLEVSRAALQEQLEADGGFASRLYLSIAAFLSDRLREAERRLGLSQAGSGLRDNELDPAVLEGVSRAGARMDRMLRALRGK